MNLITQLLIFLNSISFFLCRSEKLVLPQDFDSSIEKLLKTDDADAIETGLEILLTNLSAEVSHMPNTHKKLDLKPVPERLPKEEGNEGHYSKSLEVPSVESVERIQNETSFKATEKESYNHTINIKGFSGKEPDMPPYKRCYKEVRKKIFFLD